MAEKMKCPDCGVEMNHHADKIDYSVSDPSRVDPAFGGVVEEAHTCPVCLKTHFREGKQSTAGVPPA